MAMTMPTRTTALLLVLLSFGPARAAEDPPLPPDVPKEQQTLVRRTYQVLLHPEQPGRAYLASTVGVVVVDLGPTAEGKPGKPRYLGALPLRGSVSDLLVVGQTLVVALGPDGLVTASLADPDHPKKLARLRLSGAAMGLAADGPSRVLVASGTAGVQLVDLSDPKKPRKIAHRDSPGYARHVLVDKDRVYLADGGAGLGLLTLSGKGAKRRLTVLGSLALPGDARHLALAPEGLFVACGAAGVWMVGLPGGTGEPKVAGQLSVKDAARGVSVHGKRLAVADGTAGLSVYDIGAGKAQLLCSHKPRRSVNRVLLRDKTLLVANDHDGLLVLGLEPGCQPGKKGEPTPLGIIH